MSRVAKEKNSATVHWTITFHRGKLQMMNRRINITMPKILSSGVHELRVCCPVVVTFYPLAPFVSSVNITKSTPNFTYDKYFTSQGPYSFRLNGCKDPLCPRAAFVLHEASRRGLLVLHRRLLQQAWSPAMRLFGFDNNAGRVLFSCTSLVCCCHKYFFIRTGRFFFSWILA